MICPLGGDMNTRFPSRARRIRRASAALLVLLLIVLVSACSPARKTAVSNVKLLGTVAHSGPTATLWQDAMPSTWTPTPTESLLRPTSTPWPMSTVNTRLTMIAGTPTPPGYGCKKHTDAWRIFTYKMWDPGWCEVRGGWTSIYQYKIAYPEGWVPNTFGEFYPNLAFSVGRPNVEFKIYQFFSYDVRSFTATLEEAPEKAMQCDDSDNCRVLVNQKEKFLASETRTYGEREVLIWDSEHGDLLIRRYFLIVPFHVGIRPEDRLFAIELSALKSEIESEWYTDTIVQIDRMIPSLSQR